MRSTRKVMVEVIRAFLDRNLDFAQERLRAQSELAENKRKMLNALIEILPPSDGQDPYDVIYLLAIQLLIHKELALKLKKFVTKGEMENTLKTLNLMIGEKYEQKDSKTEML